MVRKSYVKYGVTENPSWFDPSEQWDSLSVNDWSNLGYHDSECSQETYDPCIVNYYFQDSTFGAWSENHETNNDFPIAYVDNYYQTTLQIKSPSTLEKYMVVL